MVHVVTCDICTKKSSFFSLLVSAYVVMLYKIDHDSKKWRKKKKSSNESMSSFHEFFFIHVHTTVHCEIVTQFRTDTFDHAQLKFGANSGSCQVFFCTMA